MIYQNNEHLREYLGRGAAGSYREHLRHPRFEFDDEAFAAAIGQVCAQFPDLPLECAEARAAFRLLTSGAAPQVAVALPSRWFCARKFVRASGVRLWPWVKLAWAVAVLGLGVTAVALLSALAARAEPTPQNWNAYRNALRGVSLLALPQQPGGIIVQFQQGGSALATRPAGLVAINCSTGMSCAFAGTTFTMTATGGGGTGCIPPGTVLNALLYDPGAGACSDTGLIWTSGTSTATAPAGVTLTYSGTGSINARNWAGTGITNAESLGKIPIGNGDGTASWADPFVSGITAHDAVGASTNPVLLGGYASAAAPADVSLDGDAVRGWFLRNGSQVVNLASGGTLVTLGQKAMTSSLPVTLASDQSALTVAQATPENLKTQIYGFDGTFTQAINTNGSGAISTLQSITALGDNEVNVGRMGSGAAQAILGGANYVFDGTNWDRWTGAVSAANLDIRDLTSASDSVAAAQSGVWNVTNISGTVSLPTGAATAASQGTGNTSLSSIDTKAVQQRTADYDSGVGTAATNFVGMALPASGGPVAGGTATNPVRTDPTGTTTQPVSGTVTVTDGAGAINVICDSGCAGSGGTAAADNSVFTGGTTNVTPMGALYDTTPPAVTTGNIGAPVMNSLRRLEVDIVQENGAAKAIYQEDQAATNAEVLVMAGAVRADTTGTRVDANGDRHELLVDGSGRLWVNGSDVTQPVSGTVTVTDGTGALNVICDSGCAGSGGTSSVDDAAFTAAVGSGTPVMGFATSDAVDAGDVGVVAMDTSRNLKVNCAVGCAGGAATPADNFATPTTAGLSASFGMVYDGTTWDLMRGTSADGVLVNLGANNDVAVTGSVTANAGTNLNTSALLTTTDFTSVFGAASLLTTTQADNLVNTTDTANVSGLNYIFDGAAWDRWTGAVAQSGTWNIGTVTAVTAISNALPAGTNNIGDVDVASIAAGNNNIGDVDVASSALPTGAATSASQSTEITALQLIDNLPVSQGSTTSGQSGALAMGAVTTAAPTYTTAQTSPLSLTASGELRVAGSFSAGVIQVKNASDVSTNAGYNTGNLNMPTQNVTDGATGSAVSTWAAQIGGVGSSGNLAAPLACDGYAFYDASTSGATQVVALTASQSVYVCGYSFTSSSATAVTVKWVYGTGTNCATGQTAMTPGAVLQAAASTGPIGKVIPVSGWSRGLKTAASNALCVLTNGAVAVQAEVWYAKF